MVSRHRNPAAAPECESLFEDIFVFAAGLPTDEPGEHAFRVIGQLAFDLRDDCSERAAA
jgi:hypothetical protein